MQAKSCRRVAREYQLDARDVTTVVRLHGIEPNVVGSAWALTPEQIEQIRPDLERLKKAKADAVA